MKKLYFLLVTLFLFSSCVHKSTYNHLQSSYDSLTIENSQLIIKVDELTNGEERIINLIKNSFHNKRYIETSRYITTLKIKHPESTFILNIDKELPYYSHYLKIEKDRLYKAKKDSFRLANINNLGIWKLGYYVDDFGENTSNMYISTTLLGTFSNSATSDSELKVEFLIDNTSIRIQLYEYATNHSICGDEKIHFKALDCNGKKHSFATYNSRDGDNSVVSNSIRKVRKLFLEGGLIKFIAVTDEDYGTPSTYHFTMNNADFFENALYKMKLQSK